MYSLLIFSLWKTKVALIMQEIISVMHFSVCSSVYWVYHAANDLVEGGQNHFWMVNQWENRLFCLNGHRIQASPKSVKNLLNTKYTPIRNVTWPNLIPMNPMYKNSLFSVNWLLLMREIREEVHEDINAHWNYERSKSAPSKIIWLYSAKPRPRAHAPQQVGEGSLSHCMQ